MIVIIHNHPDVIDEYDSIGTDIHSGPPKDFVDFDSARSFIGSIQMPPYRLAIILDCVSGQVDTIRSPQLELF